MFPCHPQRRRLSDDDKLLAFPASRDPDNAHFFHLFCKREDTGLPDIQKCLKILTSGAVMPVNVVIDLYTLNIQ